MIEQIRDSEFYNEIKTVSLYEWEKKYKTKDGYNKYEILNRTFKINKSWQSKIKAKFLLFIKLNYINPENDKSKKVDFGMGIIIYNLNSGRMIHFGNFTCREKGSIVNNIEKLLASSFRYFPINFEDVNYKFYLTIKKQKSVDEN